MPTDEFDRITRDPQIVAGQACVRDTGIPVYKVVQLATDGKSVDEILAAFPGLEPEDVHQVLAYAVRDLIDAIPLWQNAGLTQTISIKGFAQLILEKSQELSEEQILDFVKPIHRNALRARDCWWHLSDWAKFYRGVTLRAEWLRRTIPEILESVSLSLSQYGKTNAVAISILGDIPPIRANDYLERALSNLTRDVRTSAFEPEGFTPTVTVSLQDENTIQIRIYHEFEIRQEDIYLFIFAPSTPFATAALIIHEHGGNLEVHPTENGIEFRFTLPVWREEDASES